MSKLETKYISNTVTFNNESRFKNSRFSKNLKELSDAVDSGNPIGDDDLTI